jgi:hypothetical protein
LSSAIIDGSVDRLIFRSAGQRLAFGMLLVIDATLFAFAVARSSSLLNAVLGSLLFLFAAALLVRSMLASLVVEGRRIVVRGPLRTTTLRLDEVERFTLGRYKILGSVCQIHRRGRIIPVFAIQGITGQPRRRSSIQAERAVEDLNRRLARDGSTPRQPSMPPRSRNEPRNR